MEPIWFLTKFLVSNLLRFLTLPQMKSLQGTGLCIVLFVFKCCWFPLQWWKREGRVPAMEGHFVSFSCFVLTSSAAAASASQVERGCGTRLQVSCTLLGEDDKLILCDECNKAFHLFCLRPALYEIPDGEWQCPACQPSTARRSSRDR